MLYFYDVQCIGQIKAGKGGPLKIRLESFEEALHDTTTGLTYSALSGCTVTFCVHRLRCGMIVQQNLSGMDG